MESHEYIAQRVDDQIDWYSDKSSAAQRRYKIASVTSYIAAAVACLSPFVTELICIKYIVTLLGALIVIISSVKNLCNWHDNWISYRYTSELLKQEKFMYLNAAGVYNINEKNRLTLFTERCETIISHETINWTNLNEKKEYTESTQSPR